MNKLNTWIDAHRIGVTATLQRKSHLCIPFWELCGLSPNFHVMCLWAIYIFPLLVIFSCCRIGGSIEGIYKSLTDTWMWKLGLRPRNPFLEIFVSNFWYCVFPVQLAYNFFICTQARVFSQLLNPVYVYPLACWRLCSLLYYSRD